MKIKRLKVENLRGKSFDLGFADINLIIGANKSGKTTIADAIRFGLLGYIPGMIKPTRASGAWAELLPPGTYEAGVKIWTEQGEIVRSIVAENGRAKVCQLISALGCNVLTLDAEAFFAANGPERAAILAAASGTDIGWVDLVPESIRKAYPTEVADSWSDWANNALEGAKEDLRQAKALREMKAKTAQGLESVRGLVSGDASQKQGELNALMEKVGSLKRNREILDKDIAAKAGDLKEITRCEKEIWRIRLILAAYEGTQNESTYDHRASSNQIRIDELRSKKGYVDGEIYSKLSHELGAALQRQSSAGIAEIALNSEEDDVKKKYRELLKLGKCPICNHAGMGFKVDIKILKKTALEAISVKRSKAKSEMTTLTKEIAKLEKTIDAARTINIALALLFKEQQAIQSEKVRIDKWKEHDELVSKLAALKEQSNTSTLDQAKSDLENEIEECFQAIEVLTVEVREINHAKSQKRALGEAEEQLKSAEAEAEKSADLVKRLNQLRDSFTIRSLKPILDRAATFTTGIFAEKLGLDGTEIGRFIGSKWIPLRQFSGTEQMVACAAFLCAMVREGESNVVVLDELGVMDDIHLELFIGNVQRSGIVGQFFGFSTPRKEWLSGGKVKVIEI